MLLDSATRTQVETKLVTYTDPENIRGKFKDNTVEISYTSFQLLSWQRKKQSGKGVKKEWEKIVSY